MKLTLACMGFTALALTSACAAEVVEPDQDNTAAADVPLIYSPPSGPTSQWYGAVSLESTSSGYAYPKQLRMGGAYLSPIRRVAAPFIEAVSSSTRRVDYRQIDVDPASPTYGTAVGSFSYPASGSNTMIGLSSTSAVQGGRTDGVFGYYDAGEIKIFGVDGATGAPGPVSTIASSSPYFLLDSNFAAAPAVEAGRWGSTSRILAAYARRYYSFFTYSWVEYLQVGFLNRQTDGSYAFTPTGSASLGTVNSATTCGSIYENITAAFDPINHEWTVGWVCGSGNWRVYLHRFNWNGVKIGSPFAVAGDPSDGLHSGMMLSYHKGIQRFLVQFQHNVRLVRRYGSSYYCSDRLGNDVGYDACSAGSLSDRMPSYRLHTGGVFASEVYYDPNRYFRIGGSCLGPGAFPSCDGASRYQGVSYGLQYLDVYGVDEGLHPNGWTRESGLAWTAPPSGSSTSLHRYVRAPEVGRTVMLHMVASTGSSVASANFSFADEPAGAVDE